ncbi:MAG: hypothetical protein WKF84_07340 [Pyrinomonadaceae bacterium]
MARILANSGATRLEAEQLFKDAVTLAPNDFALAQERAANLLAAGDTINAALEYRQAFEISPQSRWALKAYVAQVWRLGAVPVAIKQHAKTLAKEPNDITARLLLAELLRSEARHHDALEQYNIVLRRDPTNAIARLRHCRDNARAQFLIALKMLLNLPLKDPAN